MRRIGLGHQLRLGIGNLHTKSANFGFIGIGTQEGEARRPFFSHVAIIAFKRACKAWAFFVEWLACDKIDRAGNAAVNHVCGGILEHFHTAQKLRRDVVERKFTAAVCGEDVAAIQLRTHIRQAADDDARSFDREAVWVIALFKAGDVDARNALQRFCHRTVWQSANVFSGNHVHESVEIALDRLRILQRAAEARYHDDFGRRFRFLRCRGRGFGWLSRLCCCLREGRLRNQRQKGETGCGGQSGEPPRPRRGCACVKLIGQIFLP